MQICNKKKKKIVNTINEDLELSESNDESFEKMIILYFKKSLWI